MRRSMLDEHLHRDVGRDGVISLESFEFGARRKGWVHSWENPNRHVYEQQEEWLRKGDHIGMSVQDKREYMIQQLREKGCRITSQRKLLIDIILRDECGSSKEIYYKAVKEDPSIGLATVYRMIKTLEDAELISRKNMYRIEMEEEK